MTSTLSGHLPRQLIRLTRAIPDPVRPPQAGTRTSSGPTRRVRHEVRDGMAVIAFSAVASTGLALVLLLLVHVAD